MEKERIRVRQFEAAHPEPHGWIQWKGTDVCIDLYCACGAHLHFDGYFMYYVQCPHCKQTYECDGHIKLHPIPQVEIDTAVANDGISNVVVADADSDKT